MIEYEGKFCLQETLTYWHKYSIEEKTMTTYQEWQTSRQKKLGYFWIIQKRYHIGKQLSHDHVGE